MMERIKVELAGIMSKLEGRNLSPQDVWDYARAHKGSAIREWMESKGCFDPKKAQQGFALLMAQTLIRRVKVTLQYPDDANKVIVTRAFVSLESDREKGGRSYRPVENVLGQAELRREYVLTALKELNTVRLKYGHISELSTIWEAIRKESDG